MSFGEAGALPLIQPVGTAQFRWQQRAHALSVPTDLDALIDSLAQSEARDVLDLTVTGQVDLADHTRLHQALGAAEARIRCLRCDLGALQLAPTPADIAALHADGYLGEVINELRDATGDDARRSQDALAILTGLLVERNSREVAA